ncbi:hypothetical protein GGI24_004024 [Coemansia furcata]|nr:hypothetical protein GGI24_004024 [Coemansia furcata]
MAYYLRKYYPARIVSQPRHDRYAIEFFDGARATLIRRRFYTQYEPQFSTCAMGEIRLIGDEPTKSFTKGDADVDPERDFERECKLYPRLVAEMDKVRPHLNALHSCSADRVAEMAATEDRMAVFFGDDGNAKRHDLDGGETKQQVGADDKASKGCNIDGTDQLGLKSPHPSEQLSSAALDDMTDLGASALAINFIHDVLLPHAIKRMLVERDGCSLDEAEERMRDINEMNWVDQILAARKSNVA